MKQIMLTEQEIELILEDIESSAEYVASQLDSERYTGDDDKEFDINRLNVFEDIIKKLK